MATVLGLGDWLLSLALTPFFVLMTTVTAAAFVAGAARRGHRVRADPSVWPRLVVVIPAHDEEPNVGATVASCLASDYDRSRFSVRVIADNCEDQTARASREAGAVVFERFDTERRSKGYALEDFFRTLAGTDGQGVPLGPDFDAAVVIDADSVVDPGLLRSVARAVEAGDDWVQCYYTVRNPDASWRTRLLTYAFSLFNGVWLLGQDRLGLGSGFRGNGMALSARGLGRVPWKAYGLVEDQEFSWMLRTEGEHVRFLPDARVYGEMVSQGSGAVTQRRRWEQGRSSLRGRFLGPVLRSRRLSAGHKVIALLDLFMPPLMPLFMGYTVAVAGLILCAALPGGFAVVRPLIPIQVGMTLAFLLYAVSPFLLLNLPVRYLSAFPVIPYFAAWKLATTFRRKTSSWVRTRREETPPEGSRTASALAASPLDAPRDPPDN